MSLSSARCRSSHTPPGAIADARCARAPASSVWPYRRIVKTRPPTLSKMTTNVDISYNFAVQWVAPRPVHAVHRLSSHVACLRLRVPAWFHERARSRALDWPRYYKGTACIPCPIHAARGSPTRRGTRLGRASAQRERRVGWRRSGPRCQRIARGRTSWSGGPDGRATIAACTCPARANTCRTGL